LLTVNKDLQGHVSAKMKALTVARPWLRVYTLPAYAPELNPVEKVWSHLKRSLANLAAGNATNLSRLAKTKLRKMQYVDGLIDGFFRATGLSSP
jgi:transposase